MSADEIREALDYTKGKGTMTLDVIPFWTRVADAAAEYAELLECGLVIPTEECEECNHSLVWGTVPTNACIDESAIDVHRRMGRIGSGHPGLECDDDCWVPCPAGCAGGRVWPDRAMTVIEELVRGLSDGQTFVDGGALLHALAETTKETNDE